MAKDLEKTSDCCKAGITQVFNVKICDNCDRIVEDRDQLFTPRGREVFPQFLEALTK